MADQPISNLNGGVQTVTVAATDLLATVDVSDTTQAPTGTTKPIAMSKLTTFFNSALSYLSSVNLGYTASATNGIVTNDGGTDSTIPLFDTASTNAGIVVGSNGLTTEFLRADGTWAAAGGAGDNLGDHIATESLKMATFNIENAGKLALENNGGIWFGTAVGTAAKEALFGTTLSTALNAPSATGDIQFKFNNVSNHILKSSGLTLGSSIHDSTYVLRVKGVTARAKFDYKIDMDNTLGFSAHTDFNYAIWAQSATVTRVNVGTGGQVRFGENNGFSSILGTGGNWGLGTTTITAGKRVHVSGDTLISGDCDAATYTVGGAAGVSGTFATSVTVVNGIVTAGVA